MKVFVWHQGALGDLILSLPSLRAIRSHFRDSAVHLYSRTDLADVLVKNDFADKVFSHEKGLFADLFSPSETLPASRGDFLAGFGAAFIFMRRCDDVFLANLRRFIPRCFSIRTVPPDDMRVHVSDFQCSALRAAGIGDVCPMPVLEASNGASDVPKDKTVIALHPGSGGRKKCWPLENYLMLASSLQRRKKYYFWILLGPAEGEGTMEEIGNFIRRKGMDAGIFRNSPLSAVAAGLKRSSLYVGNDSGITHLSAALGTPSLAIFGPTDHHAWGPKGNVRILRSRLACAPCCEADFMKCAAVRCMRGVTVESVLTAARQMLNAGARR